MTNKNIGRQKKEFIKMIKG